MLLQVPEFLGNRMGLVGLRELNCMTVSGISDVVSVISIRI